jgi:hypothetical protein
MRTNVNQTNFLMLTNYVILLLLCYYVIIFVLTNYVIFHPSLRIHFAVEILCNFWAIDYIEYDKSLPRMCIYIYTLIINCFNGMCGMCFCLKFSLLRTPTYFTYFHHDFILM